MNDRFTRRETFYRWDGRERLYERNRDRICRACIRREFENADQGALL